MRCVVSTCENNSEKNKDIKLFKFPTTPSLHAAWLLALQEDCKLEEDSAVCSEHFLTKDLQKTCGGRYQLRNGAVPVLKQKAVEKGHLNEATDVKVCRVCLKTEGEMYQMKDNDTLCKVYQTLTGFMLSDEVRLPRLICPECSIWMLECDRFKNTSLRSHLVLQQILNRHGCITVESVQSINKFHSPVSLDTTDKQTDQCHSHNEDVINIDEVSQTNEQSEIVHSPDVSKEMIADVIKVESDDVINLDIVKHEHDSDDNDNTENSVVDNVLDLQETVDDPLEIESEVMNEADVNKQSDNDDLEYRTACADEDCSPDDLSLRELTQTKTPQHYNMNDDTRREQGIDGPPIDKMSCQLCPFETTIVRQFFSHLKAHATSKSFNCDQCSYSAIRESNLKEHMLKHSREKPYSCRVCQIELSDKISLKRHLRNKSECKAKQYTCNICQKTLSAKTAFINHMSIHSREKRYTCSVCAKDFKYEKSLKIHMNLHIDNKPMRFIYPCKFCMEIFKDTLTLKNHLIKLHVGEKPYLCTICSKRFGLAQSLKDHMKIHTGVNLHSCPICNKIYTVRGQLNRHLQTHSGEKPCLCSVCGKPLANKRNLRIHMTGHTDGKSDLFSCDICNKKFSVKENLKRHLLVHSGKKPYTCSVCSKQFITSSSLKRHIVIHTGEKPYSCDICQKRFRRRSHVKVHLSTHSHLRFTHKKIN